MKNQGLGDVWTLVFPRFGAILHGGVESVTPVLVILIWLVAAAAMTYAAGQARAAAASIAEARLLFHGVERGGLWSRRSHIHAMAALRSAPVREAWREFDETLVTEHRRVYSTVGASEFFNEERFAQGLIGNRFLHMAPTALTTLGLLGTFFGLTVGLRGLDLGSTTDELRSGIQTLVDGAALGFTASLWGVLMSLLANVVERVLERRVTRALNALQTQIDELLQVASPEQSLSDIALHTGEAREALQVLHEKVGNALQESVRHIGDDTARAVATAIDGSLAPVMAELARTAADQSAEVFKEVSAQLTASFAEVGRTLAEEMKASSWALRSALEDMGQQLVRHGEEHSTRMSALQDVAAQHLADLRDTTTQQVAQLQDATTRQLRLVEESIPRVVAELDRSATVVSSATAGMEAAASRLAEAAAAVDGTSTTLASILGRAVDTMHQLAGATAAVATHLASQQESAADLARGANDAVERLGQATAALTAGMGSMRAAQDAYFSRFAGELESHARGMEEWLNDYGAQVSRQTTDRMSEWDSQTREFTSHMVTAAQALGDAVEELHVPRVPAQPVVRT